MFKFLNIIIDTIEFLQTPSAAILIYGIVLFWGILDLYLNKNKYSNLPNGNWFKSKGPFLLIISQLINIFLFYDYVANSISIGLVYFFILGVLAFIFSIWGAPKDSSKALSSKEVGKAIKDGIEVNRIISGRCPNCNKKIGYLKSKCPYCTAKL